MGQLTNTAQDEFNRREVAALNAVNAVSNNPATPDAWFRPVGRFNFTVSGVFVGTVVLERTFDGGTTWVPCGALGAVIAYTTPVSEQLEHSGEIGVAYRARMTARTSGSANVRFSQ